MESVKVAVVGCLHGEVDQMYKAIKRFEIQSRTKVDLVLCCGDFQAVRNYKDLECMAVPPRYKKLKDFHQYYSGEKKAPFLTLFVGGNHEASNYLQELPYGGWVAENIFYMGYAGVFNIRGLRIAGLSGIYNERDYHRSHFETLPYTKSTKRSIYHTRRSEILRLKRLSKNSNFLPVDVFLSHDWPLGIHKHGDSGWLFKVKPFFEREAREGRLGNPAAMELLRSLKPRYWFSGHLHVRYPAVVEHMDTLEVTQFLALDKCSGTREYLEILDIPIPEGRQLSQELSYDLKWLAILNYSSYSVSNTEDVRDSISGSKGEMSEEHHSHLQEGAFYEMQDRFRASGYSFQIPMNFSHTAPPLFLTKKKNSNSSATDQPPSYTNPQTKEFCRKTGIADMNQRLHQTSNSNKN